METNLKELIEQSHDPKENQRNVDDIINMVTAENLCSCRDPVNMAFQVHSQKMLSVTPCRPNLSFSVDLELFMMVTSSGYPKDTVGNTDLRHLILHFFLMYWKSTLYQTSCRTMCR